MRNTSQANARRNERRWELHGKAFFKGTLLQDLTTVNIIAFRDHLADLGYSRNVSKATLGIVRRGIQAAVNEGVIARNCAEGVRAIEPPNPKKKADLTPRVPLSAGQVQAIVRHFHQELQLGIWLCFIMCLRVGEMLGLRLCDWDPVLGTIHVRRQAGTTSSGSAGRDGTKTPAGVRRLPLPEQLNELIARYVELYHPLKPLDAKALEIWGNRRLVISRRSQTPTRVVFDRQWRPALNAVGLDFATVGHRVRIHFLRLSGSVILGQQPAVPGDVWSTFLGHKLQAKAGASATTVGSYYLVEESRLESCALAMEQVIAEKLGSLDFENRWQETGHLTIDEAADMLDVTRAMIMKLLHDGMLWQAGGAEIEDFGHLSGQMRWTRTERVFISKESVELAREHLSQLQSTTCSLTHARERLGLTRGQASKMLESGHLKDVGRFGSERRIALESVEACHNLLVQQRERAHMYLSLEQAARILGISHTAVNQLALQNRTRLTRERLLGQSEYVYTQSSVHAEALRRGLAPRDLPPV